ncbi:hypothetical protein Tco_1370277 [Tanacetum coccineum]
MLNKPNNQIPGSSSNPTNNPGSSTQLPYNQMPYYPNIQNPFANAKEQMLFNQFKMQMQYNQISQQQPNQATAAQPQSDQQSFHLIHESEDEDEPVLTLTSKNTKGTRLKQKAKKNKEKEPNYGVLGEYKQKARILELKRRYFEDYYSNNQYAVSIKEDTAYPCQHSPKTTKERRSIRRIQRRLIRRIGDIVCEDSGRYQAWFLL